MLSMIALRSSSVNSFLNIPSMGNLLSNNYMENKDIRRINLAALEAEYKTLENLSNKTGTNPQHLSQIKNKTRDMGKIVARRIEQALGKERGWMDIIHTDQRTITNQLTLNLLTLWDMLESQESRDQLLGTAQRLVTQENPSKSIANPYGHEKVKK